MGHRFEPASSGRSRCRGCLAPIARGEWRFGERLANPFGQGEMTLWFHPWCGAYKRPQPLLEALEALDPTPVDGLDREGLAQAARDGLAHPRLPRIDGAERAPTGQARCRHCREPIARAGWRIRLAFFEEGRFSPGGFVHLDCRGAYFGTDAVLARLLHFSAALGADERTALAQACAAGPPPR